LKEFDLNGDGLIQKDELGAVMTKMGQSPTADELNAMFEAADRDNVTLSYNYICIVRINRLEYV
jgi:Ca2+-binding EF-hand superfamily protein